MMRTQIPRFRLPESVTDEEVDRIVDLGVETRYGHFVGSLKRAAGRGLGRGVRRLRRAARPRTRHPRPPGSRRQHPYRHRLAVIGVVRPYRPDRPARHRARRRQHGDGLLPLVAPPRRRGGHGRRPLRLRGDEGLRLGEGGRDARRHPDPQLPRAGRVHARQRQADRRSVRKGQGRVRRARAGATSCRPASRIPTSRATTCWSRSARRIPSRGSSAISASSSTAGTCRRSIPKTMQSTLPNVFFGGDAAFGPKNIIWAVAHGHDAAISIDKYLPRRGCQRAARPRRDAGQPENGHPRVELRQRHLERPALPGAAARYCRSRCATSGPRSNSGMTTSSPISKPSAA